MPTITAALTSGAGEKWTLVEVDLADLQGDELLVRIIACGICGTDLAARDGHLPQAVPLPAVFGHEGAGVVEKVEPAVTEFAPGERVVLTMLNCGECLSCLSTTRMRSPPPCPRPMVTAAAT